MLPFAEALDIVLAQSLPLGAETVAIEDAVGRVLAEDIIADSDLPPFDRSQMDGYAVKCGDTSSVPATLKVVGESAAGQGWHRELSPGEAVRIMTGAPVPAGADAVQKIEEANETDGVVEIRKQVSAGKHIVRRAAEISAGEKVFSSGDVITPNMIASLAAFGYATLAASRRPNLTVLSTGSEIVAIEESPGRDQIRNSNSVMIKALAERYGAVVTTAPHVGDDFELLKNAIAAAAADADILVITGGVSVGKYDLTKDALRKLGAEIFFERVRVKPGKPLVLVRLGKTLVFGLPGNPVSAAVTFCLFVRSAMLKMQSAAAVAMPTASALLTRPVRAASERDTYLPGALHYRDGGRLFVEPLKYGGSSDFIGFARLEVLIALPMGTSKAEGDAVDILVF